MENAGKGRKGGRSRDNIRTRSTRWVSAIVVQPGGEGLCRSRILISTGFWLSSEVGRVEEGGEGIGSCHLQTRRAAAGCGFSVRSVVWRRWHRDQARLSRPVGPRRASDEAGRLIREREKGGEGGMGRRALDLGIVRREEGGRGGGEIDVERGIYIRRERGREI